MATCYIPIGGEYTVSVSIQSTVPCGIFCTYTPGSQGVTYNRSFCEAHLDGRAQPTRPSPLVLDSSGPHMSRPKIPRTVSGPPA
jgi:hypothetical protein